MGVDIAKKVFQVHYVDRETGEIVKKPIKRANFLAFFANPPSCLIGMEACGGANVVIVALDNKQSFKRGQIAEKQRSTAYRRD